MNEITKKVEEIIDNNPICTKVTSGGLIQKMYDEDREEFIKSLTSLIEQEVLKELQFIVDCDYERHDIVQRIEQLKEK